jgi:hypothetical protein
MKAAVLTLCLSLAGAALGAPVPPPRPKAAPAVTLRDMCGRWYALCGTSEKKWEIELWADGMYRCRACGSEFAYSGRWALEGGKFRLKEWYGTSVFPPEESTVYEYEGDVTVRRGGGLLLGGSGFFAGKWVRG